MFDFLKRRPDFLIIGAQKGGTSAIEFFLAQHPRIKSAATKEVGFFDRDKLYQLGAGWYAKQFPRRSRPGDLLFEATPEYLYHPWVAERIARFRPQIKLVVLLRNPVERAYSAWNMFRQMHSDEGTKSETIRLYLDNANPEVRNPMLDLLNARQFPGFELCVRREIEGMADDRHQPIEPSFVRRGLYARQLRHFHRFFPSQNILVMDSAELRTDRTAALNRVLGFLGLGAGDWRQADLRDTHAREYSAKMAENTRSLLADFFRSPNADLCSLLGRDFGW